MYQDQSLFGHTKHSHTKKKTENVKLENLQEHYNIGDFKISKIFAKAFR